MLTLTRSDPFSLFPSSSNNPPDILISSSDSSSPSLPVHSVVLAMASPFIRSLLPPTQCCGPPNPLLLPDITAHLLPPLLELLYTGQVTLDRSKDMTEFIHLMSMLGLATPQLVDGGGMELTSIVMETEQFPVEQGFLEESRNGDSEDSIDNSMFHSFTSDVNESLTNVNCNTTLEQKDPLSLSIFTVNNLVDDSSKDNESLAGGVSPIFWSRINEVEGKKESCDNSLKLLSYEKEYIEESLPSEGEDIIYPQINVVKYKDVSCDKRMELPSSFDEEDIEEILPPGIDNKITSCFKTNPSEASQNDLYPANGIGVKHVNIDRLITHDKSDENTEPLKNQISHERLDDQINNSVEDVGSSPTKEVLNDDQITNEENTIPERHLKDEYVDTLANLSLDDDSEDCSDEKMNKFCQAEFSSSESEVGGEDEKCILNKVDEETRDFSDGNNPNFAKEVEKEITVNVKMKSVSVNLKKLSTIDYKNKLVGVTQHGAKEEAVNCIEESDDEMNFEGDEHVRSDVESSEEDEIESEDVISDTDDNSDDSYNPDISREIVTDSDTSFQEVSLAVPANPLRTICQDKVAVTVDGCQCKGGCVRNCACRSSGTTCTSSCSCRPSKCKYREISGASFVSPHTSDINNKTTSLNIVHPSSSDPSIPNTSSNPVASYDPNNTTRSPNMSNNTFLSLYNNNQEVNITPNSYALSRQDASMFKTPSEKVVDDIDVSVNMTGRKRNKKKLFTDTIGPQEL